MAEHDWKVLAEKNNATIPPSKLRICKKCDLFEQVTPPSGEHSGDDSEACTTCGIEAGMRPWKDCTKPAVMGKPRIRVLRKPKRSCV